jgi:glutaredoxin
MTDFPQINTPVKIIVFTGATCPHCPGAVRAANQLAQSNSLVSVTVVDVQKEPKLAEQFHVQSVPQTVIDEELSITGVISAGALAKKVSERGTPDYGGSRILFLVEQNRLDEVRALVCANDGAAPFVSAWKRTTTALRIGLMVIVEDLLDDERTALDDCAKLLIPVLDADDAALRGDTADLLGRIGLDVATKPLKKLCDDPNPDVAEIAGEAIEEIAERLTTEA